ncbi:EcsC family protein [Curvibacter sp. APW13]|uniref:EcsC family protein n=1 Tax=Curvibacter sp. APW13 TaxID=3077236 RepID=UPI0028E03966|nr:EcsC family protein [Curvibacter sp. APW13]MDT8991792.1 EcsC family protein [Curvibacter sp. APW13]
MVNSPADELGKVQSAILDLVVAIPESTEQPVELPAVRAQAIARDAARKTSLIAASMALPPGILGWLTVLPELLGVWKVQAQMVADIASVYGKKSQLGREQMLYCLFKHVAAQLFRDVIVRVGERAVVQQTTYKMLQSITQQLGLALSKTLLKRSASRFVPFLGAATVGAYAYFDTLQVAKNATELFERATVIDEIKR